MSGADYEVGYCRPPIHTRFKKGQSGNRAGRKPGSQTVAQRNAKSVFETKIKLTIDGKVVRKSRTDVVHLKLFHAAIQGDLRAAKSFSDAYDKERRSKTWTETFDEPQQLPSILFVPVAAKPALDGDFKVLTPLRDRPGKTD